MVSLLSLAAMLSRHSETWAATPSLAGAIGLIAEGRDPFPSQRLGERKLREPRLRQGVAVLSLVGPTTHHRTMLTEYLGGTSLVDFGRQFDAAVRDGEVRAIVLEIDSPGGEYFGVQELAEKIYRARQSKRIIAAVNSEAGSVAYWIAAAAGEVVVTTSGEVGSIGVLAVHRDESQALAQKGEKVTVITYGRYKGEGLRVRPLSKEARDEMQRRVDQQGRTFTEALARYRGRSPAHVQVRFGQGRMFRAKEAVVRGMADRVATLEQVLSELGGAARQRTGPPRFGG